MVVYMGLKPIRNVCKQLVYAAEKPPNTLSKFRNEWPTIVLQIQLAMCMTNLRVKTYQFVKVLDDFF